MGYGRKQKKNDGGERKVTEKTLMKENDKSSTFPKL